MTAHTNPAVLRVLLVAVSALSAALLSFGGAWVSWGRDAVQVADVDLMISEATLTPDEVRTEIQLTAPYVAERAMLLEFVRRTDQTLQSINNEQMRQRDITTEIRTKLDILLEQRNSP